MAKSLKQLRAEVRALKASRNKVSEYNRLTEKRNSLMREIKGPSKFEKFMGGVRKNSGMLEGFASYDPVTGKHKKRR